MPSAAAFVDDLMFLSRIREAARGAGTDLLGVRDVRGLLDALRAGARLALLDLDSARLPWREALAAVRAEPALADVRVVGFFSHVHAERARDALAAGCTQALPRSAFVRELAAILGGG